MTGKKISSRGAFVRLEVLLVLAFLALLFQVFPSLWFGLLWAIDIRNWSRGVWIAINVAVVFSLFAIRFGPGLAEDWKKSRAARRHEADNRDKHVKDMDLKQQRELYKRMQDARKRQIV
jgi:hypothetical protein